MNEFEDDITSLVDGGAFGSVSYISSKFEDDIDKGTQYASLVSFIILTVNDGFKDLDYHIVIKKPPESDEHRELFNSDIAFRNEFIMYTEILPMLGATKLNLFPKLYQRINKEQAISGNLFFENLQVQNYMVTKEKIFLDYKHIEIVLKKLGEFHALSHLCKQYEKNNFLKIADQLVETKFTRPIGNKEFIYVCLERGIRPLINQGIEVEVLNKTLDKLKDSVDVARLLLKPEEPFSVICHGDFCRNNFFFKYEMQQPNDTKFFDLQNSLYTSPAIDLAFFLYMNTTNEIRNKYWDEFLRIYWKAFSNSLPEITFTYEQFLDHFAKRAIYGYFPTCFFIPMSMDEDERVPIEEFSALTADEQNRIMVGYAGEEGTRMISDIVQHLLTNRYIHKFLEL